MYRTTWRAQAPKTSKPRFVQKTVHKVVLSILTSAVVSATAVGVAQAATSSNWTVRSGESLWSIARANHISVSSLESANPNVNPLNLKIGSVVKIPASTTGLFASSSQTYTVQKGDTFFLIAHRFGINVNQLMAANPRLNPVNLTPGTVIYLPLGSKTQGGSVSSTGSNASSSSAGSTDLYWLAHVIHAEANGLNLQAQIAVGDVVLHRVQSPDYPNTVQGVVFQIVNGHYQFTCVANGYIYSQPDTSAYQAATEVLKNHVDVVPGAFVFYNPALTPASSWVWQQPRLSTIGPFIFAK